jgi:predicted oxidoreductase
MKSITLGDTSLAASRLAYGCWRIAAPGHGGDAVRHCEAGRLAVRAAYEAGFTLFDHADIYADGEGERVFGAVLREISGMRQRVLVATKCGIRKAGVPNAAAPYRYDFSADYIVWACEQSLKRLGVETVELYQLHRPDYLMQPEEVADAFSRLRQSGKALQFGVSNFRPSQVAALQRACPMRLVVNQIEISLAHLDPFEDGSLDQCLSEGITPMAWSPLAGGQLADGATRVLPSQQNYRTAEVVRVLDELAVAHDVSRTVIALGWLLRHPSGIVPIIGSTEPNRIAAAARADEVRLSREEWYRLLEVARGTPLP